MIPWLDESDPYQPFPDPARALPEPNGLLAVGGCLSVARLLRAYRQGIFPWYSAGDPICWWSPDPRTVIFPQQFWPARSLRKTLRKGLFQISADTAFEAVITACAEPVPGREETWIMPEMARAYRDLHAAGYAHSIEVRQDGKLVGGLYGVALGRVFYGESMFSRVSDASKVALSMLCAQLARWQFVVIDCQLPTAHLHRMGACDIPRQRFIELLDCGCEGIQYHGTWHLDADLALDYL